MLFQSSLTESESEDAVGAVSDWDVAVRFHELKSTNRSARELKRHRTVAVEAILSRAKAVLGSVTHPLNHGSSPIDEVPARAEQVDFSVEESLDESVLALIEKGRSQLTASDLWVTYGESRPQPIILAVDTSLSMTGEKIALTAVALAVVLLQFPDDPIGVIAFENEAQVLKRPDEWISVETLIERFLSVPAQGYTHLEKGMKEALRQNELARPLGGGRPTATVLLTDGKYTAGRDPAYLASRFHQLTVLKMGRDRSSEALCRELARRGGGDWQNVPDLRVLPSVMYEVVKQLLRQSNRML